MTKGKDWTSQLITGLFTAAAAWGSVSMEINRVVNARAEITETKLQTNLGHRIDSAVYVLRMQNALHFDSLIKRPAAVTTVIRDPMPSVQVVQQPDSAVLQALGLTNERMRFMAIAISRMQAEIADLAKHKPNPSRKTGTNPYGR